MPRHRNLNLRKFVDSVPPELVEEYLKRLPGLQQELPLESYDYEAVQKLIDRMSAVELREQILEDFTHMNDICEKSMNFIVRAVHRSNMITSGEETREHLAMELFLHHEAAFDYAFDRYCLFNSTGKMSQYRVSAPDFKLSPDRVESFRRAIVRFYAELEKGKECQVRHHQEDGETVIVVAHGSYRRSMTVWVGGGPELICFRPTMEDILQFNSSTGVLTVKAPYDREKMNYVAAFCEDIVGDESQAQREDLKETYSLVPLQDGTFSFNGNEKISSIKLREIRLSIRGTTNPDIVIKSPNVMRTLQEDIPGLDLASGDLEHAKFLFELDIEGKQKRVTFEIKPPNVTDLVKKQHAAIIGDYLKENGVKLV
jgi:hypothetical protein